jgi:hypothetical protein
MFIAWDTEKPPAPFGGAELNLSSTRPILSAPPNGAGALLAHVLYTFHP